MRDGGDTVDSVVFIAACTPTRSPCFASCFRSGSWHNTFLHGRELFRMHSILQPMRIAGEQRASRRRMSLAQPAKEPRCLHTPSPCSRRKCSDKNRRRVNSSAESKKRSADFSQGGQEFIFTLTLLIRRCLCSFSCFSFLWRRFSHKQDSARAEKALSRDRRGPIRANSGRRSERCDSSGLTCVFESQNDP